VKSILDLEFGFPDAENYRRRESKDLLNRIFVRNIHLDKLCEPGITFLMGEKGTGKTAYAVYLSNNNYKGNLASIRYIRETDYQKFLSLKREKHLGLSDYANIWKVIIYLLISHQVYEKEGGIELLKRFTKLNEVQKAIDEYYHRAFSPEIIQALQFVQESRYAAELMAKYAKAEAEEKEVFTFSESRFQTNLFYIQRKFESALKQLRLVNNHVLFIDGIDVRPPTVPYSEYLDCIKGLANAAWEVNNDFFPTIKGGGGRLRVVLLIRPDIFETLSLQNQNTKSRDNTVFLDWRTEYINHRNSEIFRVVDHLLSSQQVETLTNGQAWDIYFPWNAPSILDAYDTPTSFLSFLRWSYYRPRDIIIMLEILQDIYREKGINSTFFEYELFDAPNFKRRYSDYLLGEIKDHLTFYYGRDEYDLFLKFFEFLKGHHKFTYEEYLEAFSNFSKTDAFNGTTTPHFMTSPGIFLQFLYNLNIICYIDQPANDKPYVRWCFRERSYANISPKVKDNSTYQIFYGLYKALNVGQAIS
jgi:hypothetical protein